jgi:hypothetical protein
VLLKKGMVLMTDLTANIDQVFRLFRSLALEVFEKLDKIERQTREKMVVSPPPMPEIKPSPAELLWSAIKASKSLGVSEKTLWTFTQSGEIP